MDPLKTTAETPGDAPMTIRAESLSALPGLRHGFFTRDGGASDGIYRALNCGLGSNDDKTAVIENRRRVQMALGADDLITAYQVHSPTAVVASAPWPSDAEPPRADAIATKVPGLALGVLTADCTPVLFADAKAGVVAAAHAGWRGAVSGILEATIEAMTSLGASINNIVAGVGPCINQESYEVGPEFEAEVVGLNADHARFFRLPEGGNRVHFDLPGFVEAKLRGAKLPTIERQTLCTYQNPGRLFSYRRSQHKNEPDYGRQISAIVLT